MLFQQEFVSAASEDLRLFAPAIHSLLFGYRPEQRDMRDLLAQIGNACPWDAGTNVTRFEQLFKVSLRKYYMLVLVCSDDPATPLYEETMRRLGEHYWNVTQRHHYGIEVYYHEINCNRQDAAAERVIKMIRSEQLFVCVGVLTPNEGAEKITDIARTSLVPVRVYGAPVGGERVGLAAVLGAFVAARGWRRLAVLSEAGEAAKDVASALRLDERLAVREVQLHDGKGPELALQELLRAGARVLFVNGGWRLARAALEAAENLNATRERGFVWVTRAWRGPPRPALHVLTVSAVCRPEDELGDAMHTLLLAFTETRRFYSNDLRTNAAYDLFWKNSKALNANGDCQRLQLDQHGGLLYMNVSVTERVNNDAFVLEEWNASAAGAQLVRRLRDSLAAGGVPGDGAAPCLLAAGDPFTPDCYDRAAFGTLAALALLGALAAGAGWALRRPRARLRRARKLIERQWWSADTRYRAAAALAGRLVPRAALELRDEIGAGRSGRVRRAVLRAPGRAARPVAAKALRADAAPAEETEFLQEACTLAKLEHAHVVRLVGVCASGGPPLVLMEHAFFGDLLGYLRERRHLAQGTLLDGDTGLNPEPDPEAEHVSAAELTRLVREAASALTYLAERGIVHRDVRAANCLVDSRRALKLADFGMARETKPSGVATDGEYASRRRGLFPVLWMAPESLARGAFSAASDVWALGVLALEVMTLGARPYGAWPPLQVLHHVLEGGRPRVPREATAQARALTLACWRRGPGARPSAQLVLAYLTERPHALAPALPALDEPDSDVDSGYCEQSALLAPHSPALSQPASSNVTLYPFE